MQGHRNEKERIEKMIGKTADSRSLLGNPARFSVPALDLDAVFAGTVPTKPPHPFPPVARKLTSDEKKANAQTEQDFEVVQAVAAYKADHKGADPDQKFLQALADKHKVGFSYKAETYEPGEGAERALMAKETDPTVIPATVNPASLLGNAARQAPAPGQSSKTPLNLDAAQAAGFPATTPYPWPQSPELTDPAKVLANEQAILDFGVITYLTGLETSNPGRQPTGASSGPDNELQGIANKTGVIFSYTLKGDKAPVIYTPGKYFAGE
jgi:hypothetical protein